LDNEDNYFHHNTEIDKMKELYHELGIKISDLLSILGKHMNNEQINEHIDVLLDIDSQVWQIEID